MSNIIVDNNGDIQKVTISDSSVEETERYNNTTIGTNWKKFLTEKLMGECWDAHKRLGGDLPNRTFSTYNDMIDLYRIIRNDKKWNDFLVFLWTIYLSKYIWSIDSKISSSDFIAWLFCLDFEDCENRCKIVAKFYGWEEKK
jgi:hypothetical protein